MAISKKSTIEKMQSLGCYKPEFDPTIERYVALTTEYKRLYTQYKNSGYKCEVETATGVKKSPLVTTLESLRKDILNVEDSLGLTPRGLLKINEKAFEKPRSRKSEGLI